MDLERLALAALFMVAFGPWLAHATIEIVVALVRSVREELEP